MMNIRFPSLLLAIVLVAASAALPVFAAAPAGSQIGNQASATYADGASVTRTVTSNTVITTVQQVASLSFSASGTKTVSAGGQVYYPHTIVNTGNGPDSFTLAAAAQSSTFAFTTFVFYADANGDGVPDNAVPITTTGQLAAGQAFNVVAAGVVPPTAIAGNTNTMLLTATSTFPPATVNATVTDITTITGQAVINTTQSIDIGTGPSPSTASRTITMTYTNTGNTTATNVVLTDLIPSGMTYVANSARWSVTGAATQLTDADATDNQSGIVYDQGVTVANRVTAKIASVAPGASGTVSFKVNVNGSLPSGIQAATTVTGTLAYNDGAAPVSAQPINPVRYIVTNAAAVSLTGGAAVPTATQGGTVVFTNTVTNLGNTTDSFDITTGGSSFPVGTTFQLFQADGVTPLVDTNGNGTPDSGPLAPGASVNFVIRATLPPGSSGSAGYAVTTNARSKLDATQVASAANTLNAITGNTLDLTNDTAGPGSLGYGPGAEPSAVATLPVQPGATVRFTLVTANGAGSPDTFGLQASTDVNFASQTLPAGWSVVFRDSITLAVIDNTGVVGASSNKTVFADVTVPAGAAAGTTQLYFRALSAATGVSDKLHDAVTVGTVRALTLSPNHSGQVVAAGTVVYVHTLTNAGNVLEGDGVASVGTLALVDAGPGFTSVVYWDRNNDGVLDPTDPPITTLASLTGGTNGASTAAGLDPGETARLFVKVTSPASAVASTSNVTTLTATLTGTVNTIVAPAATAVTDSSTVIASQVTLVKTQSIDVACDGTADNTYTVSAISSGAAPGNCIRYEITATNAGPVTITGLVVNDATPAWTVYTNTVPASVSSGSVTAPANGSAGSVQATVGSLAPGASVVLRFGVRITP